MIDQERQIHDPDADPMSSDAPIMQFAHAQARILAQLENPHRIEAIRKPVGPAGDTVEISVEQIAHPSGQIELAQVRTPHIHLLSEDESHEFLVITEAELAVLIRHAPIFSPSPSALIVAASSPARASCNAASTSLSIPPGARAMNSGKQRSTRQGLFLPVGLDRDITVTKRRCKLSLHRLHGNLHFHPRKEEHSASLGLSLGRSSVTVVACKRAPANEKPATFPQ
jgi:hypothetical protein